MKSVRSIHETIGIGSEAAPVVVRVILGYVMAAHGWEKLDGGRELINGLGDFLATKNVPLPDVVAWVVPFLELGGGILLILGLATRWAAALIGIHLALAALVVTRSNGLIGPRGGGVGYERDLVYIAGAIVVFLQGPGRPSLDHLLGLETNTSSPSRINPETVTV